MSGVFFYYFQNPQNIFVNVCTPFYSIRGSLGSLMAFSCNLGVLISFIIGHYFQYAMRPVVLLAFPIAFLLLFVYFPETPVFLMRHGRDAEAEKSLRFYRNAVADAGDLDGRPDADAAGPMLKVEMEEMRRTQQPADEGGDEKTNAEKANAIPWSEFSKNLTLHCKFQEHNLQICTWTLLQTLVTAVELPRSASS